MRLWQLFLLLGAAAILSLSCAEDDVPQTDADEDEIESDAENEPEDKASNYSNGMVFDVL